jgi:hypothetical protein
MPTGRPIREQVDAAGQTRAAGLEQRRQSSHKLGERYPEKWVRECA